MPITSSYPPGQRHRAAAPLNFDADSYITELLGVPKEDLPGLLSTISLSGLALLDSDWTVAKPSATSFVAKLTEMLSKLAVGESSSQGLVGFVSKLIPAQRRCDAIVRNIHTEAGSLTPDDMRALKAFVFSMPEAQYSSVNTEFVQSQAHRLTDNIHPVLSRLI